MIVDLTSAFTPKPTYDVCVIGSGPAGITLARALARHGRSVFVAEAGGRGYTADSQEFYKGTVVGDPYFELDAARLRCLGGTSGHWGGWCRRLDVADFLPKTASPIAHWPIGEEALRPYEAESREILEIAVQPEDRPLPGSSTLQQVFLTESSPPVPFGLKYEAELDASPLIDVCVYAAFVGFEVDEGVVTAARVRNGDGIERSVAAERYVLACGSIENSRLLLNENRRFGDRLGNGGGCVGRYWMEHPTFTLGEFLLFPDFFGDGIFEYDELVHETHVSRRWYVAPTPRFMQEAKILNCGVRLEPVYRTRNRQYIADLACASPGLHSVLERFGRSIRCVGEIRAAWEQEPVAENRVALGEETDPLGIPRPVLHWTKNALDRRTARATALEVGRYMAERDIGRIHLAPWLLNDAADWPVVDEIGGYHHMGGTRMAASEKVGVADANCLVFGTRNLYVAGSSLFPSGGHANPTQTIVQLSLRLADHLHDAMARGPGGPVAETAG